jgi:hypothetical protein
VLLKLTEHTFSTPWSALDVFILQVGAAVSSCRCSQPHHAVQLKQRAARLVTHAEPEGGSRSPTTATEQTSSSSSNSSSSASSSQALSALAGGFLSSPQQQSAAYLFLTGTSVAFGVAALAAPQLLLTLALGVDATPLDVAFTRIAGATMAISAAVEYSLQVRLCIWLLQGLAVALNLKEQQLCVHPLAAVGTHAL